MEPLDLSEEGLKIEPQRIRGAPLETPGVPRGSKFGTLGRPAIKSWAPPARLWRNSRASELNVLIKISE